MQDLEGMMSSAERMLKAPMSRREAGQLAAKILSYLVLSNVVKACAPLSRQDILSTQNISPSDPRFYFEPGPSFADHVNNGKPPGVDWLTSSGQTLVTAMAEGKITWRDDERSDGKLLGAAIFGGRGFVYGHLTEIFGNVGDYIGRYTIVGTAGERSLISSGFSPPHIHADVYFYKPLLEIANLNEPMRPALKAKDRVKLDADRQGKNGSKLELWNGQDFYTEDAARTKKIVEYLDTLIPIAGKGLREKLERDSKDPAVYADAVKIINFYEAARKDRRWIREERDNVIARATEFVQNRQILTLPFVNPELFKIPDFYEIGSQARTLKDFERQYEAKMNRSSTGSSPT